MIVVEGLGRRRVQFIESPRVPIALRLPLFLGFDEEENFHPTFFFGGLGFLVLT